MPVPIGDAMATPATGELKSPPGAEVISGREIALVCVSLVAILVIASITEAVAAAHNVFVMLLVPGAAVAAQVVGFWRWRPALIFGALLLDLEALLAALNFASGSAFAVLLPVLSVRVAQLQPDRRLLRLTGVAALASSIISLVLAVTVGPVSGKIWLTAPLIAVMITTAVTIGVLEWVVWRRLDRAQEAERREVAALERAERTAMAASVEVRGIIDATEDALVVVDASGRIRDANEAATRLAGRPRRALIGTPVKRGPAKRRRGSRTPRRPSGPSVDLAGFLELLAPVAAESPTLGLHRLTGRRADGTSFQVEVSVSALDLAGKPAYVAAIRDISERLATDEDLRRTRELLETVVAAAPLAIVSIDLTGTVRYFNLAAERMLGWSAPEAVGRDIAEVTGIGPDDYTAFGDRIRAGGTIGGLLVERRTRDGRPISLRLFVAPLRGANGAVSGAVILMEDVTERQALEAQLRQAQKMETLGQLSGAIAHDFNNLLQAIHGYAELAGASAADNSEVVSSVGEIERAADRAADLTRQLLTFSQPGLGQARVVRLDSSVSAVLPMIRHLLGPNIQLVTVLGAGERCLLIDPAQLEQAVLNLAVNGRDAMPRGGILTIETGHSQGGGDDAARPAVYLTVRDTGAGISPEIRERIFEPFFTTKGPGQGSGLGLAIVFGVVRGAAGEIELDTEPGRGTAFTITFPEARPAPEGKSAPPVSGRTGSETVLLVEDEDSIRRLAERILTGHGYRVLSARDAAAARELWAASASSIGLLLSDVTLPGISGPALAAELMGDRPLRVLFVSGRLAGDPAGSSLPPGAAFLPKPFTVAGLLDAVRVVLDAPARKPGG
jgi:two-component system cell cycle sensor histidine kinase/response regulator CckA